MSDPADVAPMWKSFEDLDSDQDRLLQLDKDVEKARAEHKVELQQVVYPKSIITDDMNGDIAPGGQSLVFRLLGGGLSMFLAYLLSSEEIYERERKYNNKQRTKSNWTYDQANLLTKRDPSKQASGYYELCKNLTSYGLLLFTFFTASASHYSQTWLLRQVVVR